MDLLYLQGQALRTYEQTIHFKNVFERKKSKIKKIKN